MERLGLSAKLLLTLNTAGVQTFDELKDLSPRQLARLPGIGRSNLAVLLSALHPYEFERIASLELCIREHHHAIEALEAEIKRVKSEALLNPPAQH